MNSKQQTHYYIYNDTRYDNMKDCCTAIGNGLPSKAFKHMLRIGIVKKIIINNDVQENTKISRNETKKETETKL